MLIRHLPPLGVIECVLGRKQKVCARVIHPPVWVLADTTEVIHWLSVRTEKNNMGEGGGCVCACVWF